MFGLVNRTRRPTLPVARHAFRPSLEALEARDCPSFVTLNVAYGAGRTVTLYGHVSPGAGNSTPGYSAAPMGSSNLGGVGVNIWGAAKGAVPVDANGNYSLTTQATKLDEVDAATTDGLSNTASLILSGGPPFIGNFAAHEEGNTNNWDITGNVTDGNFSAAGLSVQINGQPVTISNGGQGQSTSVQLDGSFFLTVKLNGTNSDNGVIYAQTTDLWGYKSNQPMCEIYQPGT
jgi:hypothetical protein